LATYSYGNETAGCSPSPSALDHHLPGFAWDYALAASAFYTALGSGSFRGNNTLVQAGKG